MKSLFRNLFDFNRDGKVDVFEQAPDYDFAIKEEAKAIFTFERGAYFSGSLRYRIFEMPDCMIFSMAMVGISGLIMVG